MILLTVEDVKVLKSIGAKKKKKSALQGDGHNANNLKGCDIIQNMYRENFLKVEALLKL